MADGPTTDTAPLPTTAFVTCVEAGMLEDQTVRLADSLRRFGGRFKDAEFYAVQSRFGAPIARATRAAYDRLGVRFVRAHTDRTFGWYKLLNKPVAVLDVDRRTTAEQVCWIDSDTILTGEPTALALPTDIDFAACATERNIATTGPGDRYFPFWEAMCAAVGLTVDDLPWDTEQRTGLRIRAYFNSGVMPYRRASGYAQAYMDACLALMRAKIALSTDGIYYHEQSAAGLAMVTAKCRWQPLPESHNYEVSKNLLSVITPEKVAAARVVHYHQAMRPDWWQGFLDLLRPAHPAVSDWLGSTYGPLQYRVPLPKQAIVKVCWQYRERKQRAYRTTCREFPVK